MYLTSAFWLQALTCQFPQTFPVHKKRCRKELGLSGPHQEFCHKEKKTVIVAWQTFFSCSTEKVSSRLYFFREEKMALLTCWLPDEEVASERKNDVNNSSLDPGLQTKAKHNNACRAHKRGYPYHKQCRFPFNAKPFNFPPDRGHKFNR